MDTYEGAFKAVIPTPARARAAQAHRQRVGSRRRHRLPALPGAAFVSGNTIRIDGAASGAAAPSAKGKPGQSRAYNGFHRAYLPDVLKDQED